MKAWLLSRWTIAVVVGLCVLLTALMDMVMSTEPMSKSEIATLEDALMHVGIPTRGVKFKWLTGWRADYGTSRGLCASYRCLSHSVVIPKQYRAVYADPAMLPTYAHELTHAAQRRRMGVLWYILRKTFRRHVLEDEAEQAEMRVLDLVIGGA